MPIEAQTFKTTVRVASAGGNITVSGPGATIDGVTMAAGDRVLLKDQSTGSQNGIYRFTGAATAMTRAYDMSISALSGPGHTVWVAEGSANANTEWSCTNIAPIVLATTALVYRRISPDSGTTVLQAGIVGSGDLLLGSISINTSTCALTFTPAATTSPALVKSAGGLLTPVSYGGAAQTITPGTKPASTFYMTYCIEMDTAGLFYIVNGAQTATQLNTNALIWDNGVGTTSGRTRIGLIAVWNNAGVYNFSDHTTVASQNVNWVDDRKVAVKSEPMLGFKVHSATAHVPGTTETVVPWSTPVQYDSTGGWTALGGLNRFHPHQAGYWQFTVTSVQASGAAVNAWYELRIRKNSTDMGDALFRGQAGSAGGAMNFSGVITSPADGISDVYDVTDLMSSAGGISNQVWWTGVWLGF